jgi:hypothetical protein
MNDRPRTRGFPGTGMAVGALLARDARYLDLLIAAGDDFLASRFDVWFKQPIARAAYRIATGEPPENIQ